MSLSSWFEWIRPWGFSLPTSLACITWHFPKRVPGQKLKIGSLPPSTKPRPLNPLTMGPLLLYQLSTSQWCFGHCVLALLLLYFCFLSFPRHFCRCRLVLFSFCYVSLLPMFILYEEKIAGLLLGLTLSPFIPFWANGFTWQDFLPYQPMGLLSLSFFLPRAFMTHQLSLYFSFTSHYACGPADSLSFTYFFELSQPVFLAFTSCCVCGPACPLDFIFIFLFSLGFYGPFALLLPFIVPVSLLAIISYHTGPLGFYLFFFLSSLGFYDSFASILLFYSFLLYFCLLLGLYAVEHFYQKRVSILSNNTHLINAINYLN